MLINWILFSFFFLFVVEQHHITPLHVAAKWGKSNMVTLFLDQKANLESKTRDGLTPLHCAARSGHETVVELLLERGAPFSSKTKNGLAPLHMSAQGDHVEAARVLLNHKAPVDEVDKYFQKNSLYFVKKKKIIHQIHFKYKKINLSYSF